MKYELVEVSNKIKVLLENLRGLFEKKNIDRELKILEQNLKGNKLG